MKYYDDHYRLCPADTLLGCYGAYFEKRASTDFPTRLDRRLRVMYKVYLVDDDSIILEELTTRVPWLENGFEVVGSATDPEIAIDEVKDKNPDVVFCDLKMPEMDGNEMIRKIRENGSPCEFVMVSAYDDYEDVRGFFKQSGYDYILKPIKDDEIRILLEKLYIKINAIRPDEDEASFTENPAFNRLIEYVDDNFTKKLSLEQISDQFGFSKNYVCQLFKKHFNTTFSLYLTGKRMELAKQHLSDKTLSVSEVAYLCGYGDYHSFYRVYKNYYGCSPKENR